MFELEKLKYEFGEFGSHLSVESFEYHYKGHHATYVNNLNQLLANNEELKNCTLEEIILKTHNKPELIAFFNNAAQVWNHNFFWNSIKPEKTEIKKQLLDMLKQNFEEFEKFKEKFCEMGTKIFGSGWIWLVFNQETQKLEILQTTNAHTPLTLKNLTPLLVLDIWEHAYYIDYRNKRALYLNKLFDYLNWDFALENFKNHA